MVLLDRFRIQLISGNLRAESTILFPIVWGHIGTFAVNTLGLIHHQNSLVGSYIWFLSGSHIDRQCRFPADEVRIQDAGQKKGRIWELLCLKQAQRCRYSRFLVSVNVLLQPSDFWGAIQPCVCPSQLCISNDSALLFFREANRLESKFG